MRNEVSPNIASKGKTPLHIAVEHNNDALVALILKHGGKVTTETLLLTALMHENAALCALLIPRTIVTKPEIVWLALEKKYSPDKKVGASFKDIAVFLLAQGAPFRADDFLKAIEYDDHRVAHLMTNNMLLSANSVSSIDTLPVLSLFFSGADDGTAHLLLASKKNNTALAERLIGLGVPYNKRDATGASALWYACYYNNTRFAKLLISRGSDLEVQKAAIAPKNPDSEEKVLWSPFLLAAYHGNGELLKTFLDITDEQAQKYYLSARCSQGLNALHLAIESKVLDAVDIIALKWPELVNIADARGYTPLILVCTIATK